ncbi:MAG: CDP-alcohol phosphatidyltransferase family protein [Cardiobacteriaceae bacterium]|nr:CDP-alcohol phosphatidyltransferase family protein [Cardiobacteriaceae bacterium]
MTENRRPIASRDNPRIQTLAARLAARPFPTPNQISVASAIFAALGAWALCYPNAFTLLFCALMIQLRLFCNLLDGMVAVEGGKKTYNGAIYNEFPDRVADSVLLVALGYATPWPWLGWLAALLALTTAYIRVFGGSLGLEQHFAGPMAKQHRMAVLTAACLLAVPQRLIWDNHSILNVALIAITLGSAWTCWRRTRIVNAQLRQHA